MRVFTFRKPLLIALGLSLCLACGLVWNIFRMKEDAHARYTSLMGEANPGKAAKNTPYTAQQNRKGVQKDLLFTRNGKRLQMRLVSKEATMVLEHQVEGTYLMEQMRDVKCWMQEDLTVVDGKTQQVLRYLEADSATYSYKNDQVVANDVKVFRYILPGQELPATLTNLKPTLKGHAEGVQFSMAGKDVQFKAQKLKASLEGGAL